MDNHHLKGFEQQLLQNLNEAAEHLRDFIFTSGCKQFKVLNTLVGWKGLQQDEIWGKDPIH
jgi:hypothetical protein